MDDETGSNAAPDTGPAGPRESEARWPVQWTDRLQRLASTLSRVVDPESMAEEAASQGQAALDADGSVVFLLSAGDDALEIAHATGYPKPTSGRMLPHNGPNEQGPAATIVVAGATLGANVLRGRPLRKRERY